ncbi:MAG: hypothetical protein A2V86_02110 [Deltaproteobacteria bacterium RBG_16_49_23]|nr:MAG: hypothetical protein A2V86_02110 [Deltaproteobacteria bacterium RBG_16_49_23]
MGRAREPGPTKLFMSLIVKEEDILHQGIQDLQKDFGEIDFISQRISFNFTQYYTKEIGENLFRHFITFKQLISRDSLPGIKLATNRLEEKYAATGKNRRINIDPGYLCMEHVILATTKAYTHRPYLSKGIYADMTLIYRNKSFQPLDWTYPDYRQEETLQLFNRFRKGYMENLKEGEDHSC